MFAAAMPDMVDRRISILQEAEIKQETTAFISVTNRQAAMQTQAIGREFTLRRLELERMISRVEPQERLKVT